MSEDLKIYIDRLRDWKVEKLDCSLSPESIDLADSEISFPENVHVKGEAYTAEDTLVLHLNIQAVSEVPCIVCNQAARKEIILNGVYHTIPIAEVKSGMFHMGELIREDIMLEAPAFLECNLGNCPERTSIDKYLKKEGTDDDCGGEEFQQPFSGLTKE